MLTEIKITKIKPFTFLKPKSQEEMDTATKAFLLLVQTQDNLIDEIFVYISSLNYLIETTPTLLYMVPATLKLRCYYFRFYINDNVLIHVSHFEQSTRMFIKIRNKSTPSKTHCFNTFEEFKKELSDIIIETTW